MYGIGKMQPWSFKLKFFLNVELSHKHIVNKLKQFKESFRVEFLDFIKFLSLFVSFLKYPFLFQKTKNVTIKLSLNHFKLFTTCLCDNWSHVCKKKFS